MKKLFLITTILLLLNSCQKETFYKTLDSGKVLTLTEYDDFKEKLVTKFKLIAKKVELSEILTDSIISNDSIIKTYKLDLKIEGFNKEPNQESKTEKEKIYNYLDKELPSQILYTIDNKKISLKEFRGKPIVLNFWFATCKPCIDEMPVLNKIMKNYSDKVNFISITYENKESVKLFLNTHQFDYLIIVGAESFIDKLGIQAFPKNIFIDKNGIVRKIENGIPYIFENDKMIMGNGAEFEKFIKELL
jgi:thiol-disulfide isomerase/thioredoxin